MTDPRYGQVELHGNSMNLQYYTKYILAGHIKVVKEQEAQYNHTILLQEDNDSSHGTRTYDNDAYRLKIAASVQLLEHPPKSPDLNPIEAVWNIMKEKLKGNQWETVLEFKIAIQAAWHAVTQEQIRRRIREMPKRCETIACEPDKKYTSDTW